MCVCVCVVDSRTRYARTDIMMTVADAAGAAPAAAALVRIAANAAADISVRACVCSLALLRFPAARVSRTIHFETAQTRTVCICTPHIANTNDGR